MSSPLMTAEELLYATVPNNGVRRKSAAGVVIAARQNQQCDCEYGAAFLGLSTFFQGYLITKSTFLPRFLGIIAMISGLSWLTYTYPALGSALFYYLLILAMLGLLLTSGWLIVRGVDEQRWREQAQLTRGLTV